MIWYILSFSILGGVLSLVGGVALLYKKQWSRASILVMVSFAAGVLLSTSFTDLLPEAVELAEEAKLESHSVLLWALVAMSGFFFFERSFAWFHHHHEPHKGQPDPVVSMVWVGDTLHNAIDGLAITASFLVSVPLGITTAIAVAAHELPQEIADFSLYLSKGVSRTRTIALNILSSFSTVAAAIVSYIGWSALGEWQPQLLAFTAGMFIYIAGSDLIPELHGVYQRRHAWFQSLAFLVGVIGTWGLGVVLQV